ncbi:MAG: DEAD/DEAH box helicase [Chloroflexi bacterium HGW-Chloroflexi-5]|jgi:type I restriction enzyme R subunit|nr:MAG: DEAD/DEAH box helicase [Chloroflexi bacterium HGW-Chloroflexi-5]
MISFSESIIEQAAIDWFTGLGYTYIYGKTIEPESASSERDNFSQVVLSARLHAVLSKLNPSIPAEAIEDAFRKLTRLPANSLVTSNRTFHHYLVNGIEVSFRRDGNLFSEIVRLFDFENPENNDWLVVNQFTVLEEHRERRPDLVVFINGLPLAVFELKNAADENATIWSAFNQLQTYKQQIPSLMLYNEALVISDGLEARIGSLSADRERFMPWKTIEGHEVASSTSIQLDVLINGLFEKTRFLNYLRHFIVFEDDGRGQPIKKMAGYHQFHAVNVALEETLRARKLIRGTFEPHGRYLANPRQEGKPGDQRIGVIWHTQGSGKSLTMAFYAGRVILEPAMHNPTIIVITDRNDLDDQLFGTFSLCSDLLRQKPVQASSHDDLIHKLSSSASGGVYFTTIQKFLPPQGFPQTGVLTERSNIVVIADEAHRSQYDFIDGFAAHMRNALPNASFIGFTGTPIELRDSNTRAVFGDYISIYDIQQAVLDGATVPIYYEGRLAKLELKEQEKPHLDDDFEEATEGEEIDKKERLKTKWAALEAIVGADHRIKTIARDFSKHFQQRIATMDGKVMFVCMSRRICIDLYKAIVELHPEWHSDDPAKGKIKIVMTGSATDPLEWQAYIHNKAGREALAKRFKDPSDPLQIVIVRDMWLTGFDVPPLHTMYVDKPMRGHGLMQAIARVNRVFKDKPGGLIVDYLGLADQLREALATYTESGGLGSTAIDQMQAVSILLRELEVCRGLFHGFDWSNWGSPISTEYLAVLRLALEHILAQDDGRNRLMDTVARITSAFALSVPNEKALAVSEEIGFYQAVRGALAKVTVEGARFTDDIDHAIQQIVSRAVASDEVIDIFSAAGLKKPMISLLSDEFLEEVSNMPQHNLAFELLRKLLNDEIKNRSRRNLVQSRSFAEMLEKTIRAYQNRAIETAQVIDELIQLAKDMREANLRGERLNLTEDELAFYDALEVNDSAVKVLGDENLKIIARELVETVRNNVTIDWTVKESVRAKLRVSVKRILRRYGYPPDLQEKATLIVLEQAELIAKDWAE